MCRNIPDSVLTVSERSQQRVSLPELTTANITLTGERLDTSPEIRNKTPGFTAVLEVLARAVRGEN